MSTSSQTPPGVPSPETSPVKTAFAAFGVAIPAPAPYSEVPAATPAQAAEVFAAYGQPLPSRSTYADPWDQNPDIPYSLRSPFPEPATEGPACVTCQASAGVGDTALRPHPAGLLYPSGAQVLYCITHLPATTVPASPVSTLQAAAAVMSAEIKRDDAATSAQLAQAEQQAGLLFDAEHVEAVASAARAQAAAEYAVELQEARTQLAEMAGEHRRVQAVRRLCEGRRGDDLLLVSAVAVAAESGTTALDSVPMTIRWTGQVDYPLRGRSLVRCTSSYGQDAVLLVEGEDRTRLASLVDAEIRDVHAPCPRHLGCGAPTDYDMTDPKSFGWFRLDVAGIEGGPHWYCSPGCVTAAMTRAREQLAAADRAAAVNPGEQAYDEASYLDERYGPGASDEYALQQAEAVEQGFADERGDVDVVDEEAGR